MVNWVVCSTLKGWMRFALCRKWLSRNLALAFHCWWVWTWFMVTKPSFRFLWPWLVVGIWRALKTARVWQRSKQVPREWTGPTRLWLISVGMRDGDALWKVPEKILIWAVLSPKPWSRAIKVITVCHRTSWPVWSILLCTVRQKLGEITTQWTWVGCECTMSILLLTRQLLRLGWAVWWPLSTSWMAFRPQPMHGWSMTCCANNGDLMALSSLITLPSMKWQRMA